MDELKTASTESEILPACSLFSLGIQKQQRQYVIRCTFDLLMEHLKGKLSYYIPGTLRNFRREQVPEFRSVVVVANDVSGCEIFKKCFMRKFVK